MHFAKELEDRLHAYARGEQTSLQDVLVDWSGLTPFQQRVLRACRRIPWGVTRTYADLASAVGSPKAARAVGGVMSRNRVPLVIPCHRVIASNGGLGGFSSRSGLKMKRRLLQLERPRAIA
jgi:methylated-DNA-[protein]-cysteine S-methyltransferase